MSRMDESCHVWMSHVTYGWVMEQMSEYNKLEWVVIRVNESCHVSTRRIKYALVIPYMNASIHIRMRHVTYEWIMSRTNESYHSRTSHVIHEWVTSHKSESRRTWMSHATHKWVKPRMEESSHKGMSHVTKEWVMAQQAMHVGRILPALEIWDFCGNMRTSDFDSPCGLSNILVILRRRAIQLKLRVEKDNKNRQYTTHSEWGSWVSTLDLLQCVAVCCSVLQWIAVCCVLQCIAVASTLDLFQTSRANPVKWHSTHNKAASKGSWRFDYCQGIALVSLQRRAFQY